MPLKRDPIALAKDLAARSGYSEAAVLAWVQKEGFQSWDDMPQFWNEGDYILDNGSRVA